MDKKYVDKLTGQLICIYTFFLKRVLVLLERMRYIIDSKNENSTTVLFVLILYVRVNNLRPFHIHTVTEPKPNRKNKMP